MIRKLNFTGRRKIPLEDVDIDLQHGADGVPSVSCSLKLDRGDQPEDARVYLEAYARYGFQRVPVGTLGSVTNLQGLRLPMFTANDVLRFRVKVIDESGEHGRILRSADAISPRDEGSESGRRLSLLPVEPHDLGQRVWKIEFRDDGPVLVVNRAIEDIFHRVTSDPGFRALVFPELVREVLSEIVLRREDADPWDSDEWQGRWLQYALRFHSEEPPASADATTSEKQQWLDAVLERFCEWARSADLYREVAVDEARVG